MVGTVDELLPDRGPVAAEQALRAAAGLRVFDGAATAWLVVQRLLEVVGVAMVLSGVFVGSVLVGQWVWVVGGAAVLLLVWEGPVGRYAGAEPRRWPTRWRVALLAAAVLAVVLAAVGVLGSRAAVGDGVVVDPLVVVVGCYLLAPAVRWLWSLRRPRRTTPWPDGAQAYAVLAVLARVQWMHPDRLAALTELPRERCDAWVAACAARGLAVPAGRRNGLLRHVEITPSGRARLGAWTAELTGRAAGADPVGSGSSAATSP